MIQILFGKCLNSGKTCILSFVDIFLYIYICRYKYIYIYINICRYKYIFYLYNCEKQNKIVYIVINSTSMYSILGFLPIYLQQMTLSPSSSSTLQKIYPLLMISSLSLGSTPAKKTEVPSLSAPHFSTLISSVEMHFPSSSLSSKPQTSWGEDTPQMSQGLYSRLTH